MLLWQATKSPLFRHEPLTVLHQRECSLLLEKFLVDQKRLVPTFDNKLLLEYCMCNIDSSPSCNFENGSGETAVIPSMGGDVGMVGGTASSESFGQRSTTSCNIHMGGREVRQSS